MKTKKCNLCNKVKSRTKFYTNKDVGSNGKEYTCYQPVCKECAKKLKKEEWAKIKDRPEVKRKNREKTKKYNLKNVYNITLEDYNKLVEKQNGLCAICGKIETTKNQFGPRSLCVDHDHNTGKVRGLLCSQCNHLLGNAKDDIDILSNAITYLKG